MKIISLRQLMKEIQVNLVMDYSVNTLNIAHIPDFHDSLVECEISTISPPIKVCTLPFSALVNPRSKLKLLKKELDYGYREIINNLEDLNNKRHEWYQDNMDAPTHLVRIAPRTYKMINIKDIQAYTTGKVVVSSKTSEGIPILDTKMKVEKWAFYVTPTIYKKAELKINQNFVQEIRSLLNSRAFNEI